MAVRVKKWVKGTLILVGILVLALFFVVSQALAQGGFTLSRSTVDNGGGTLSSGDFTLSGAIGQPDAGFPLSNGDFVLVSGAFAGGASAAADLVITKAVTPTTPVNPGQTITYTLTFSNAGAGIATGVFITDHVPVSVTVTGIISDGVLITDTGASPPYVWRVQDLANGDGGTITITGQITTNIGGFITFTNIATITTTAVDSDASNDSYSATVRVSPLLISEIMYNPASDEDDWEWIEIYNSGNTTVDLAGYVIDDDNGNAHSTANIASGSIGPGETAILFNADDVTVAAFEAAWGTGINLVSVTHWWAMALGNGGDRVGLWTSFADYSGDHQNHNNVIDDVDFDDSAPWPVDNNSASIYLTNLTADNNDGNNWALSTTGGPTPYAST